MSELVGVEVGRYRITKVLGQGGMGTVYEAVRAESGGAVAIKVLSERYARDALVGMIVGRYRIERLLASGTVRRRDDLRHHARASRRRAAVAARPACGSGCRAAASAR